MRAWIRSNRGFLIFILCLGFFRTAIADWNTIPSGSMRPTLLEGNVVLVNRLAYDFKLPLTNIALASLGEPRRGDIVTFESPKTGMRLIKRVVGVPGDTIELRGDVLFVNGVAARYSNPTVTGEPLDGFGSVPSIHAVERFAGIEHPVQILPGVRAMRDFGPFVVPKASYFMLGDNRDNSEDSRYIGPVPRRLLLGRASRLVLSVDVTGHWMPRIERIGKSLD